MNKIIVRTLVLLVAVLLLLIIVFRNRSPFGRRNSSFGIEPEREITRIELSAGNRKLKLEKNGDNWLINDSTEARKTGIFFLERILEEMKIKSTVSPELFDKEITDRKIDPVRVKVYGNRKLLKSFIVYKTASNIYGNIMKIRESSKPFIICVPGYEGDIGSAFTINELFWEPFMVFNLLPSEIHSVKFENIADSSSSFSILTNNHRYTLSDNKKELTGFDSTRVSRYLSYFTRISFEDWAFSLSNEEKKKVESQMPLYIITVTTVRGITTILKLWKKSTGEAGSETTDSDRLFGKTEKSDEFFIMRYFDIDPLIKKRSYFFQ